MIVLNEQQVILLHQKLIDATGGSHGIRDKGALSSSLNNAFSTYNEKDLYPTVVEKAANICYCLIGNHPFVDGNKRIGLYTMLVLLEVNDFMLEYTQEEIIDLGFGIAEGKIGQSQLIDWIHAHIIQITIPPVSSKT